MEESNGNDARKTVSQLFPFSLIHAFSFNFMTGVGKRLKYKVSISISIKYKYLMASERGNGGNGHLRMNCLPTLGEEEKTRNRRRRAIYRQSTASSILVLPHFQTVFNPSGQSTNGAYRPISLMDKESHRVQRSSQRCEHSITSLCPLSLDSYEST